MTKAIDPLFPSFSSKRWFLRCGWFYLILGCGVMVYFHAMKQKEQLYHEMTVQLEQLEKDKALALASREELLLQIQSQTDPAWVEMVLKRNLGVVREGQVKVYFHNNS